MKRGKQETENVFQKWSPKPSRARKEAVFPPFRHFCAPATPVQNTLLKHVLMRRSRHEESSRKNKILSVNSVGTDECWLLIQLSLRDSAPVPRRYPSDKSLGYSHSPQRGTFENVGNRKPYRTRRLSFCGIFTTRPASRSC
jgi:hypothetical protein